ncbi:MAG: aminopeptidase P family protein [Bacteroidota bacterium]
MKNHPSNNLFEKNRSKLKNHLQNNSLVILFSNQNMPRNGDQFHPYRENSDFFYFTGIEQENSALILTDKEEYLFIQEQTENNKLWEGEKLTREKAEKISGIQNIESTTALEKTFANLTSDKPHVLFNIEQPVQNKAINTNDEFFFNKYKKKFPFLSYHSVNGIIKKLRLKKEYEEIEIIKQGIEITHDAFNWFLKNTRPGINENELEAGLRYHFHLHHSTPAYDPIIASGKNACTLHYIDNNAECKEGELLLLDIGAETHNYASDISRTIPINGTYSQRQKECYEAVLEVQNKTIKAIEPGLSLFELNQKALEWLTEKHIELGLYKRKDLETENPARKYFPHGIGHFIGLDVHDCGNKNTIFEPGMVITCEPGIYIPEEGIGIRIEDNIFIDDQAVNLSEQIPKDVETIEKIMDS